MNFANAMKKIPNLNKTNSPSTSIQGIQQPDEDREIIGETNLPLYTENLRVFENEQSREDDQSSKDEQPSSPEQIHGYCTSQKK